MTNAWYILEIENKRPRFLGPYDTSAGRRRASIEMLAEGREVYEVDGHHSKTTGVQLYAAIVPREERIG